LARLHCLGDDVIGIKQITKGRRFKGFEPDAQAPFSDSYEASEPATLLDLGIHRFGIQSAY